MSSYEMNAAILSEFREFYMEKHLSTCNSKDTHRKWLDGWFETNPLEMSAEQKNQLINTVYARLRSCFPPNLAVKHMMVWIQIHSEAHRVNPLAEQLHEYLVSVSDKYEGTSND